MRQVPHVRRRKPVLLSPYPRRAIKAYIKRTYGIEPLVEGAIRGAVEQARDEPSQWPQDGQGYADRFGSAMVKSRFVAPQSMSLQTYSRKIFALSLVENRAHNPPS